MTGRTSPRISFYAVSCFLSPAGALGLWLLIAGGRLWGWSAGGEGGENAVAGGGMAGLFAGWLLVVMVLLTLLVILRTTVTAARGEAKTGTVGWQKWLPAEWCGLLAIFITGAGGSIPAAQMLRVALLIAAWLWLWQAAAGALGRIGAGAAVVLAMVLAMAMIAGPVAFMPAVRAAGAGGGGGPAGAGGLARMVMTSCPAMGVLQALRPAVNIEWSVLPGMYAYSGLGQEVPIDLPAWWACTLYYAGAAAAVRIITVIFQRRIISPAAPANP